MDCSILQVPFIKLLVQLLSVRLVQMGGRNTVLLDAISWRIPLVSDIPTIIFGADVTHPETGEDSSPSIAAVMKRILHYLFRMHHVTGCGIRSPCLIF